MSSLEQEEPEVAATAVVGIAKLMLAGMVTDEEVRPSIAPRCYPVALNSATSCADFEPPRTAVLC